MAVDKLEFCSLYATYGQSILYVKECCHGEEIISVSAKAPVGYFTQLLSCTVKYSGRILYALFDFWDLNHIA
jgi:hypothetical protein